MTLVSSFGLLQKTLWEDSVLYGGMDWAEGSLTAISRPTESFLIDFFSLFFFFFVPLSHSLDVSDAASKSPCTCHVHGAML